MNLKMLIFSSQAFAWFSDLLVEHAEIFWSLFAVDMDSTLEMQPPDTWDSFPLFQLLNDYLRNDGMYGKGICQNDIFVTQDVHGMLKKTLII